MDEDSPYPCPCCGYLTLGSPGAWAICPICYWEDDPVQLRWVTTGGANRTSLIEAQLNFDRYGWCHEDWLPYVRRVRPTDVRDPTWRKVDRSLGDVEPTSSRVPWPDPPYSLYYWRPDYWRRKLPAERSPLRF